MWLHWNDSPYCCKIFSINQWVAQGCTLLHKLFLVYVNDLMCEIEKLSELGVKLSKNKMSGLLFAEDFVGVTEIGSALQTLKDIVVANAGGLKPKLKTVTLYFFQKQGGFRHLRPISQAGEFGVIRTSQF